MVSSQESDDRNVSSDNGQKQVSPRSEIELSQDARSIPSILANNEVSGSDDMACDLVSSHSSLPKNHSLSPNTPSHELPLVESGLDTPSIVRERVLQDGYNWRKYGQKQVKGNEFKRSYYKCTYSKCIAKKYLQLTNDGNIEDCICIGEHNHSHPQPNNIPPVDPILPVPEKEPQQSSLPNVEAQDNASVEYESMPKQIRPIRSFPPSHVSGTDELNATEAKRPKIENNNIDATRADVASSESCHVKSKSKIEAVYDGYRWRKYGQKMVKGSPYPRSYYRCSSPGCPAKKHVEKSSQGGGQVIASYEGKHDHQPPVGRGVPPNTLCDNMFPFRAVILPNHALEGNLNKEEQENEEPGTKEDSVRNAMICDSCSEVPKQSTSDA